jgi:hypothetical protein
MTLSRFAVDACNSQAEEIVMTGWSASEKVVVRMSKFDIEGHLRRRQLAMEQARRIASLNIRSIEQAVYRKYARGEFHIDSQDGLTIACVHLEVDDIVENGDPFVDIDVH